MKYLLQSLMLLVLASCGSKTNESQPSQDSISVNADTVVTHILQEDSCLMHIRYVDSPDMKSIYYIGRRYANSNGWIIEYQLIKADRETDRSECIVECAAIEAVPDGFIIARARLVNEETATCTADEEWMVHDEKIDFDGNVVHVSKNEYDYREMVQRFGSGNEDELIKGFNIR